MWVYYKNNLIFYSNQLYKYKEKFMWIIFIMFCILIASNVYNSLCDPNIA